jgi:hypothetical protein
VPALILPENKRGDPMPPVFIPLELPVERTRDEIRHSECQPINMHVRSRTAFLILPSAGPECRQMLVGLAPVAMKRRRLVGHKPEGANT